MGPICVERKPGTADPFEFVEGATITAHLDATIVGGTGRFEGATGHVAITGTIPSLVIDGVSTGVTSWTGWLTY